MSVFLTGFPGFLGASLVERLLARDADVVCLVQPSLTEQAADRAAALRERTGRGGDALRLVTGDLTESELGLSNPAAVRREATEIYHLAAIYNLGVAWDPAYAVNVEGTRRMLDFAGEADIDRFHHVSTCYVSGRHDGVFGPEDFAVDQTFNNNYEETKFLAERAVRQRLADGLPATIYRPAIAVGDSETGETDKYDGLYYLLRLIDRSPGCALVPVGPRRTTMNIVPRDFVVGAIDTLAVNPETVGETYQLCDPGPTTIRRLIDRFATHFSKPVIKVPVPTRLTGRVLAGFPALANRLGVEPAAVPYLSHPTSYVAPNSAAALGGTDVSCPSVWSYLDTLVEFFQRHPDRRAGARA